MPQTSAAPAIPYREARAIVVREIARAAAALPAMETVSLETALDRVLAAPIHADRDYPPLDRTARDGFAVRAADLPGRLRVVGEVRAGERFPGRVRPGEAVEIMTGAPIPDGADAVIMIEHVTLEHAASEPPFIAFNSPVPVGQFINRRGGESLAGNLLLPIGTRLGAAEIGLLAAIGCAAPPVFCKPRVAIVATGDELVNPEAVPAPHQIRNSNAYSLAAQVRAAGGIPEILGIARDEESATRALIDRGLASDLLLLSGGVSAGKYDVVEIALRSLGATFFFDRVAIQPGQPLVFGHVRGKFFFGLPGNPASTMVTFALFARTALELLAGQPAREPVFLVGRLSAAYRHRPGLTRFLPASVCADGLITPIPWTGSSDMAALTRANAFMVVDAARAEWSAGDSMPVFLK